jgi:hypothetical protein
MDPKKSQKRKPFYKWRPPEGNETKRVISIKDFGERAHVWNTSTKRWIPEGEASANLTSIPNESVPPAIVASTLTNAVTGPNNGSDAALGVQMADVQY